MGEDITNDHVEAFEDLIHDIDSAFTELVPTMEHKSA